MPQSSLSFPKSRFCNHLLHWLGWQKATGPTSSKMSHKFGVKKETRKRLKVEDVEQPTPSSTPDYIFRSGTNQVSIFRKATKDEWRNHKGCSPQVSSYKWSEEENHMNQFCGRCIQSLRNLNSKTAVNATWHRNFKDRMQSFCKCLQCHEVDEVNR